MTRRTLVALLAFVSLGSAGCEQPPPPDVPEEEPPVPAETIAGRAFATTISTEEAAAEPRSAGTWEVALAEDGTFQVSQDGMVGVQGRYTIDGNRITFTDESGPAMCEAATGTYEWTLEDGEVAMLSVDDTCPGRLTVLTTRPLRLR